MMMEKQTVGRRRTVVVAPIEAATYSASAELSGVVDRRPARAAAPCHRASCEVVDFACHRQRLFTSAGGVGERHGSSPHISCPEASTKSPNTRFRPSNQLARAPNVGHDHFGARLFEGFCKGPRVGIDSRPFSIMASP